MLSYLRIRFFFSFGNFAAIISSLTFSTLSLFLLAETDCPYCEYQHVWCCLTGPLSWLSFWKFVFLFGISLGNFHYFYLQITNVFFYITSLLLIPSSTFFFSVTAFFSSDWFFLIFSSSLLKILTAFIYSFPKFS